MNKNKLFKSFIAIGFSLCMMIPVSNVFAATVSKTKSATVTTSNSCKVAVYDTAKKNTTTGAWSFSLRCNSVSVPSGYTAQVAASKLGTNPVLTNNGNTAKHSVVVSILRSSSGQSAGGAMKDFTFTYSPSTGKIS